MLETLFRADMSLTVSLITALVVVVVGLIGATAWVVLRFGADRFSASTTRGRQSRLAVIDAAKVDERRRLILIRRDNVEHLIMVGGPTDVVVGASIVRAADTPREAQAPRPPAATDTRPRAVPLGEGNMWPRHRTRAAPDPLARWADDILLPAPSRPDNHSPSRRPLSNRCRCAVNCAFRVRRPPRIRHHHRPPLHRHRRRPPRSNSIRLPTRISPRWLTGSKPHCAARTGQTALPSRHRGRRGVSRPNTTSRLRRQQRAPPPRSPSAASLVPKKRKLRRLKNNGKKWMCRPSAL